VDSKVTRQPIDTVRSALEAHDDGVALNRIAKDLNCHHTAVKRVIEAATALRQKELAAVGRLRATTIKRSSWPVAAASATTCDQG